MKKFLYELIVGKNALTGAVFGILSSHAELGKAAKALAKQTVKYTNAATRNNNAHEAVKNAKQTLKQLFAD